MLFGRLEALLSRNRLERELEEELAFHRAVRGERSVGNGTYWKEETRGVWMFPALETLAQDIRYAARVFGRAPLFFGGAALVLALGVGANCAIFSLVQAVLLRPLPYHNPNELLKLSRAYTEGGVTSAGLSTTSSSFRLWREGSRGVLSDLAAIRMGDPFDLVLPDRAERLRAGLVTPNFFSVLGVHAAIGRVFSTDDERARRDNVVVLSYGLWQRAYGGDPAVIGCAVRFTTGRFTRKPAIYTVIGVLPREFGFSYPLDTELWAMETWADVEATDPLWLEFDGAVARLAPGVSFNAARAHMAHVRSRERRPGDLAETYTYVERISDSIAGRARPSILLLAGVSALLLLIACSTVANTLLVRLAERRRELAVRISLGAGRRRLARQLLTEGLLLSAAGSLGGLVLAGGLLPLFRALAPVAMPRADEMRFDLPLALFAGVAATAVTLLTGLLPVLQALRTDTASALKGSPGTASAAPATVQWRLGLITVQTGVAAALLATAMLLLASFWRLHRVDLGFDGNQVLTVEMRSLTGVRRVRQLQQELSERVRALPGVLDSGMTSAVPFRGVDFLTGYSRSGQTAEYMANKRYVDAGYFSVMRIGLVKGRYLAASDTARSESVVVISESVAREAFAGEEPLGKRLDLQDRGAATVVGVVKDVRYAGIDQVPAPAVYVPWTQDPSELMCLVLRTAGDAHTVARSVQRLIHQVDPTLPAMNITTIDQIVSDSVAGRRFYTTTTTAFAALALVLTACGLIVVIARSVAERRRELAIRSALGARSGQLVGLVTRQGLAPVLLGTGLGLAGAWAGAQILEQFLFEVKVHEPSVFVGAGLVTLAVAMLACIVPARRVSDLPPSTVLQGE